jgi:hypothetical protein
MESLAASLAADGSLDEDNSETKTDKKSKETKKDDN